MARLTTALVARTLERHGCRILPGPEVAITGGSADSRSTRPGDLFAAYPGENTDGNLFVEDAFRAGAVAALCSRPPGTAWPDRTVVVSPDVRRDAGRLARHWLGECRPRVVGITGTVGKTTAKELTAAVVSRFLPTHHSPGNLNSREGLPLAVLSLGPHHKVSVLEMAMDSRGEIADLVQIAHPEIGCVLNIGYTHVEKLGSIEAIAAEKLSLVRTLPLSGTAVLNVDDPRIAPVTQELRCRMITFGTRIADLRWRVLADRGLDGTEVALSYGGDETTTLVPLPGLHTVPAGLCAIAVALALGRGLREAAEALRECEVAGRLRVVPAASGARLLDDRYNSSPASLAGALELLGGLGGRRIAFLGRMAELGGAEEREHRAAGEIAAANCDLLVAAGESCRALVDAAVAAGHADAHWFETRDEAAAWLGPQLREGDTVLVKASRGAAFELALPILEGTA